MRKNILLLLILLAACSREPASMDKPADNNRPRGQTHAAGETPPHLSATPKVKPAASTNPPPSVLLDVPLIKQNPELKYGCEVTSLAMLLQYAGINAGKMGLADQVPKDRDPAIIDKTGNIIKWGDPKVGFVGDMTGKNRGYAVYAGPMEKLLRSYMGDRAVNLTGQPFSRILGQVQQKKPVVVWTTGDYRLPDRWESWMHQGVQIKTPLDLHAVVIVGYDNGHVYLNDPLSGVKAKKVNRKQFIHSWQALGAQALSYR